MYSPKIREDLVPRIYKEARNANLAMTTWVNQVIERALPDQSQPLEIKEQPQRKEKDRYE